MEKETEEGAKLKELLSPSEKIGEQRRQAGQHGAITLFADRKVVRCPVRSPEKETPK